MMSSTLKMKINDEHIKYGWTSYFDELFNGSDTKDWSDLSNPIEDRNRIFVRRIRMIDVMDALSRMKIRQAVGLDDFTIEISKCLGDGVYAINKPY